MLEWYLTTHDLRKKYSVSRQAIHEWRKLGLPNVKLNGMTIMYNEKEAHQWLINNMGNRKGVGVIK